jgi:methylated-DNA-[protein]-cysteine S-methyltransferase
VPTGTAFQKAVWQQIAAISPRTTTTYGQIARVLGMPGASRAVGQAVGANPFPILIPCHRVLAAGGKLGGYSSGLRRKRWLLAHEGLVRIG